MPTKTFIINGPPDRIRLAGVIGDIPEGYEVVIRKRKRTHPQNAALWAALDAISEQVVWHGHRLSPEEWKDGFTASLDGARVVPGVEGTKFVRLGKPSSLMTSEEFSDLLNLVYMFGSQQGVTFNADK